MTQSNFPTPFPVGGYPPAADQNVQAYAWQIEYDRQLYYREKFGIGFAPPPACSIAWLQGPTVHSISKDTGGTDYTVSLGTDPIEWAYTHNGVPSARWVDYVAPQDEPGIPRNYDLVIVPDETKPWKTVRGRITKQTPPDDQGNFPSGNPDHVLTIQGQTWYSPLELSIQHAIAGGWLASVSTLVGAKCYIVKSGVGWSSCRWPNCPGDYRMWAGNCSGGQAHYPPAPVDSDGDGQPDDPNAPPQGPLYLYVQDQDPKTSWTVDQFVDKEVGVEANDGSWRRAKIVHNDKNRLYIALDASWAPGGLYAIGEPGFRFRLGDYEYDPSLWYAGPGVGYYTRVPDNAYDVTTRGVLAATKVKWYEDDPDGGDPILTSYPDGKDGGPTDALDLDLYVHDNVGGGAPIVTVQADSGLTGDAVALHLYKTQRHRQVRLMGLLGSRLWVRNVPEGTKGVEYYTTASGLLDLGRPGGTTTVYRDGSGNPAFGMSGEAATADEVYWAVYNDDASIRDWGGPVAGTAVVSPLGLSTPADTSNGTDAGKKVIYAVGLSRFYERRVRWLYPREVFIPDVVTDPTDILAVPRVADPPGPSKTYRTVGDGDDAYLEWDDHYSDEGLGAWNRREASTHYAEYDAHGRLDDTGPAFVPGDNVRYGGDSHGAPTITQMIPASAKSTDPQYMRRLYYDRLFEGTYAPPLQGQYQAGRSGTATHGGADRITVLGIGWWSDGVNSGVLHTMSAQPTAASATSVTLPIDTSRTLKMDDGTPPPGLWLKDQLYPCVGTPLRVVRAMDVPDPSPDAAEGATVSVNFTYKTPITAFDDSGGHVKLTLKPLTVGEGTGTYDDGTPAQPPLADGQSADDPFAFKTTDTVYLDWPRYTRNKWEGQDVTLTDPSGAKYYATVELSDNDTLWLTQITDDADTDYTDQALQTGPGWSVAIDYVVPGSVMRRTDEGEFVAATGPDEVRLGVETPRDFLPDPKANLATIVERQGLARRDDFNQAVEVFGELYAGIELLQKTSDNYGWTSRADPATPEKNTFAVGIFQSPYSQPNGSAGFGYPDGHHDTNKSAQDAAKSAWDVLKTPVYTAPDGTQYYPNGGKTETGGAPQFTAQFGVLTNYSSDPATYDGMVNAQVLNRYAYPTMTVTAEIASLGPTATLYGWGIIIDGDPPDRQPQTTYASITGHGQDTSTIVESKFDAKGASVSYHAYSSVGSISYSGQSVGSPMIGPKIGNGDEPDMPAITDTVRPPDADSANYPTYGNASSSGTSGYTITRPIAVLTWPFPAWEVQDIST